MPRLTEAERQNVLDNFYGHYEELLVAHPGWEIEPGFGLTQLRALGTDYLADVAAIDAITATGMPAKRAQRDALFGTSFEDPAGIWLYLRLYKGQVTMRLPKSALRKTVPNLGVVTIANYDSILRRFEEHWALVNAALPAATPLVIGPITLAELQNRRAQIAQLESEVDETQFTRLSVMRAEKEALFGDVREEEREPTSIVSHLQAYSIQVQSQFAGTPLAATLPRIFPEGSADLPRFPFNFRQNLSDVVVWFVPPVGVSAAVLYLKEGAYEETRAIPVGLAMKVTFSGVAVQEDVDEVELRDAIGKTVAHGRFDGTLIEPV